VSTLPAEVVTERLRLPLWTREETADIVAGRSRPHWHPDYPRQDDRDAASLWREGDAWGPRHLVRGRTVLGSIGFFGPPTPSPAGADAPAEAEVGYGLVAEARGWGFATEALRALLAETDRVGVKVRAGVRPDNRASIRVLARCGFTELRGADEEGNLVMARPLPVDRPGA
jgi:RimJ/RimL family protein N-acetyltransferase